MSNRVAILYICTGAYDAFWKEFYRSFEEKFLPNTIKEYFVFTDAAHIYDEENCTRIHRIPQENLGWPGNTLFRFRIFSRIIEELKEFDYVFFMNANIICQTEITEEEFLPIDENLLVVRHPGFYDDKPYVFSYERDKKSLAYIPYTKGKVYVCGGVNGGKADSFIELIQELDRRITIDYENGIIAAWHDESHINKYILDRNDYKLLSPSYAYPEGWDIPFEKKLLLIEKEKVIKLDQSKLQRQKTKPSLWARIKKKIELTFWGCVYYWKK